LHLRAPQLCAADESPRWRVAAQAAAGVVFAAFELRVDVLMAMRLNGSEVDALLPAANATNASAAGALVISAVLFRRGRVG
jgi:hypothetical protein